MPVSMPVSMLATAAQAATAAAAPPPATPLTAMALWVAFGCFGLAQLFCLYRVVFAPGLSDRVLALDTMAINMIALLTLLGLAHGTAIYFEAAMLFAMTGFVSTVAYARFVLRGDIIE